MKTVDRLLIYTKPRPSVQDAVTDQTLLLDAEVEAFDIIGPDLILETATAEVLEWGVADWFRVIDIDGDTLLDGSVGNGQWKRGDITFTTVAWEPGMEITVGPVKVRGPS